MKRKRECCHPLEFALNMSWDDKNKTGDFKECRELYRKLAPKLEQAGCLQGVKSTDQVAYISYTAYDWLKYKQCYQITEKLAEDLFMMDDLSFPMNLINLPFPTIYLDFENLNIADENGRKYLGVMLTIQYAPYGNNAISLCSIVTLGILNNQYVFSGIAFDFNSININQSNTLSELIDNLTEEHPSERLIIGKALLFSAYLASKDPDITENEYQKRVYRQSGKPKYSSVRKWDVGVRYMRNLQERGDKGNKPDSAIKKGGRLSPRPHMRKAHWHIFRTGKDRKDKVVLWIPPTAIGVKEKIEERPVVYRKI